MRLQDLPLEYMATESSNPTQEGLDFLVNLGIPIIIKHDYQSPEDTSEAFDGAFTAYHIHTHLTIGADKTDWLNEVLGWYDLKDKKELDGPFYFGLKWTLKFCGMENFYREALNYIEMHEGAIDN